MLGPEGHQVRGEVDDNCHGMEQILVLPNAYAYPLRLCLLICLCLLISTYVCYLLMYICLCLWSFVIVLPLMHAYVYLSICLWVTISAKEFSVGLRSKEEREVFNLVLYQERRIYVYKRTCPPTVLSFFSFFFM
jgi:hypothetical protein